MILAQVKDPATETEVIKNAAHNFRAAFFRSVPIDLEDECLVCEQNVVGLSVPNDAQRALQTF